VYAVLDCSPGAVVGVDADGCIDYVGPAAESVVGYPPEELLGRPVDAVAPRELSGLRAVDRADFVTDPGIGPVGAGAVVTGRRKDGTTFPAEVSLLPLDTVEGPWLILVIADVTARHRADRRLQDLGRAYQTLADVNRAIIRSRDEEVLFARLCGVMVERGGYLGACVVSADEDGEARRLAGVGPVLDHDTSPRPVDGVPVDHVQGFPASALRAGLSRYTVHAAPGEDSGSAGPGLGDGHRGVRASALLPLREGGTTRAMLVLHSQQAEVFDAEMRTLLESVADNVSLALDRIASVRRLDALAAQRRALSRRLIATQEEERARIAADVHDDSVQALSAVDLRLGLLRRRVLDLGPEVVGPIDEVQRLVGGVTAGLRELLSELEVAETSIPLPELLTDAVEHLMATGPIRSRVEVRTDRWDHTSVLSSADRGQALRIVREALGDIRARGRASQVVIGVAVGLEGVQISITDDGGIPGEPDPAELRRLASMRDRAEVSAGWLRWQIDDTGGVVRFWMPYDPTAPPYMGPTY
jgi:PAS domain S-box-containing protein